MSFIEGLLQSSGWHSGSCSTEVFCSHQPPLGYLSLEKGHCLQEHKSLCVKRQAMVEFLLISKCLLRHKAVLHPLCLALALWAQGAAPSCSWNCSPGVQPSNLFWNGVFKQNGFPLVRFQRTTKASSVLEILSSPNFSCTVILVYLKHYWLLPSLCLLLFLILIFTFSCIWPLTFDLLFL